VELFSSIGDLVRAANPDQVIEIGDALDRTRYEDGSGSLELKLLRRWAHGK
jgi:hypothetical protein